MVATDNRSGRVWRGPPAPLLLLLPTKTELRDQRPVPLDVVSSEVVEQPTAPTHEHEQSPTRVMVLLVDLQVLGEMRDAIGEQRDLDLGRTGIGLVNAVLGDRGGSVGHREEGIPR